MKQRIKMIDAVAQKFGKYSQEHTYCLFVDNKTLKSFYGIFFKP